MMSVAIVLLVVFEHASAAPCIILAKKISEKAGTNIYPNGISAIPAIPISNITFLLPLFSIHPINGLQITATSENRTAAKPAPATEPPLLLI